MNYILEKPFWLSEVCQIGQDVPDTTMPHLTPIDYYVTAAHHSQFTHPGWQYLQHWRGVGHLTGNGTYVSYTDPSRRHLTIVIQTMVR